ncbi:hypothetical protein KVR01_009092 [Diaporthe batatas]|uniref:uncharacterized protein n=1 Tax=Diaporthe batatas TaxID=748121 RepID=UPI001D04A657|nr:uncharacterized protein KVR01_009092 [Diaporthe batatas]KAG8160828.1 hypothetical protein KVR01_009092 [Diaporthe batatas]
MHIRRMWSLHTVVNACEKDNCHRFFSILSEPRFLQRNIASMSNYYEELARAIVEQSAHDKRSQPWKSTVKTGATADGEWYQVGDSVDVRKNAFPMNDVRTNAFPTGDEVDVRKQAFPMGGVDVRTNAFPMGEVDVRTNAFPMGEVDVRTNAFPTGE